MSNRRKKTPRRLQVRLDKLLASPGNRYCADCSREQPSWASINLGLFVCMDCSGIHRSLGVHISQVRSVSMDTWKASWVAFMEKTGNVKANAYWEARLPAGSKPTPSATMEARKRFIRTKYEQRLYYGEPAAAQQPQDETASTAKLFDGLSVSQQAKPKPQPKPQAQARQPRVRITQRQGKQESRAERIRRIRARRNGAAAAAEAEQPEETQAGLFAGMGVREKKESTPTSSTSTRSSPPTTKPTPEEPAKPRKFIPRQNARMANASPWVKRAEPEPMPEPEVEEIEQVEEVDEDDDSAFFGSDGVLAESSNGDAGASMFSGLEVRDEPEPQQPAAEPASAFNFLNGDQPEPEPEPESEAPAFSFMADEAEEEEEEEQQQDDSSGNRCGSFDMFADLGQAAAGSPVTSLDDLISGTSEPAETQEAAAPPLPTRTASAPPQQPHPHYGGYPAHPGYPVHPGYHPGYPAHPVHPGYHPGYPAHPAYPGMPLASGGDLYSAHAPSAFPSTPFHGQPSPSPVSSNPPAPQPSPEEAAEPDAFADLAAF